MQRGCPSDRSLRKLLAENFDSGSADELGRHLNECEACRVRLEGFAARSWEHLGSLRERLNSVAVVEEQQPYLDAAIQGLIEDSRRDQNVWSPDPNLSGQQFGDFKILGKIAQGGMGVVYRARQESLNRLVALKLLATGAVAAPDRYTRFRTETEAVATITHPNIVPIYGVGEIDGQPYFVMKLIEGGSLSQRLEELTPAFLAKSGLVDRREFQSRERRVVEIMISICLAIQYTHERGILHRDLKPNNILLDEDGEPHITDFGLAKILEKDSGLTESFAVMGTPGYMAPEQANGRSSQTTTATDVYGLGAIFYELLCGEPPFKEATPLATMRRVTESEPEAVRRRCRQVDSDLETVCLKALSKEPRQRYASAQCMADDLVRWSAGKAVLARPISYAEKSWRWTRRNPLASSLAALIFILLSVIGVGSLLLSWHVTQLYRESEALVTGFQLDEVEELLSGDDSMTGIALLGRILEHDSNHEVAATRLVSALIHRDLAILGREPLRHGAAIFDVKLSSNQKHVVALGTDGRLSVWRLGTTEAKRVELAGQPGRVSCFDINASGDRLVAGCASGDMVVWDLADGREVNAFPLLHDRPVLTITIGCEGQKVATGDQGGVVQVWQLADGTRLAEPLRHDGPVRSVVLNRFVDEVMVVSGRESVHVWDVEDGRRVAGPFRHIGQIRGARVDPLERRILTFGAGPKVVIWDIQENRPVTVNIEHKAPITDAGFSPDGRLVVTVGEDGYARVFDSMSGKFLREFSARATRIEQLCFDPLGKSLLLIASGGSCQLWDPDGGSMRVNAIRHPGNVRVGLFAPDGRSIVTGGEDGFVRFWKVGKRPKWRTMVRHSGPVNDARFLPDGRALVTVGQDGMIQVTDAESGQRRFTSVGQRRPIGILAVSDSGRLLLTGEHSPRRGGTTYLWDSLTGELAVEPYRLSGRALSADFNREETMIVVGAENGSVSVWRTNEDQHPIHFYRHRGPVHSVSFDQSGERVISAGSDGRAVVSRIALGTLPEGEIEHEGRLARAIAHPSKPIFLTASSDHTARMWRLNQGKGEPWGAVLQHEDGVDWAEFSHDGSMVLTASADGTVAFWNVETGERMGVPIRHSGPVMRAHYSPDDRQVIVVGRDKIARLWGVSSRFPLSEPWRHSRDVYEGHFSPDGTQIVTSAADDAARVWRIPQPPLPIPLWFTRFLGCVTGVRVDSKGTREVIEERQVIAIRSEVSRLRGGGYYESLAKWLLTDGLGQSVDPFGGPLLAEYVQKEIQHGSFASLSGALNYSPTNGVALARQADLLIGGMRIEVRHRREADFLSRLAVDRDRQSPERWATRARVMKALGRIEAEWEAVDQFLTLQEGSRLED